MTPPLGTSTSLFRHTNLCFSLWELITRERFWNENGLYTAMSAGQSQLGEGHVYWMQAVYGDDISLQAEYNTLTPREQQCATHLPTFMGVAEPPPLIDPENILYVSFSLGRGGCGFVGGSVGHQNLVFCKANANRKFNRHRSQH